MIENGFLCMPIVDESEEPIFIPEGFGLFEVEMDNTSRLIFKRSSEGVWETLTMYFYIRKYFYIQKFEVVVYAIEYRKEEAREDFSHSIYTQEFSTFAELKDFFKAELTKAS